MRSIEFETLITATALRPDEGIWKRLRHLVSGDMDADLLISMGVQEGLACLLYKNLLKAKALDALGQQQSIRLHAFYHKTLLFNIKLIHELKEVLSKLRQNKIRVVLLQGMALLGCLYDDIGLRPMTDIDLWALKEDYDEITKTLGRCGYRRDALYPNTFRKGAVAFDLHTHILWADRIKARRLLLHRKQNHIYKDARAVDFEDLEALRLSPFDQVIYLSLHTLKHNAKRLIWLVDIKHLVAEWGPSEWEGFWNRTKELGQERPVAFILILLRDFFPLPIPEQSLQIFSQRNLRSLEKRSLRIGLDTGSLPTWTPILLFSSGLGMANKLSFILETLFPRPDILRQVFMLPPGTTLGRLYWMRILQIVGRIRGAVRGLHITRRL